MKLIFRKVKQDVSKKKEKRRKIKMIRKINKKKLYSNKAIRIFRKRIAKRIVKK
jgi:hypothetical protein